MKKYRIGIIGCGKMAFNWLQALANEAKDRWETVHLCDVNPQRLEMAKALLGSAHLTADAKEVLSDKSLDAVGLFTLSDNRPPMIRAALANGLHIVAEKPIASTLAEELELLKEIEASDRIVCVNIFSRNAWYHHLAMDYIAAGEIGKLGIIRICHLTAGIMPGTDHTAEGPCFHDCGMHYVDVARWYAASEFGQWHAQGLRMWGEDDPWWMSVHGTFRNNIAFEITQGFVYGQMAKNGSNNSYTELIGTKGVIHISHDFVNTTVRLNGVKTTSTKTASYGGKKCDVMLQRLAESLDAGHNIGLPSARDSVIASDISWQMFHAAKAANPPSIGTPQEMAEIIAYKQKR